MWCCNSVFNSPDTNMLIIWRWYVYTWYLIPDTWYLILILDMLSLNTWSLTRETWYMKLTCYHLTLGTFDLILRHLTPVLHCIFMIITFTGTWHDYYIVTGYLVLLNSCILEPLKKGDSWYYTPVDPHNWITMNIGLLRIPCGHYHWTICSNWTTYTGMR